MQPSAKSLVLDLLSTLREGTMPVRALVAAAELFGIEENSLRVGLARLYAAGTVSRDERGRYRLARSGSVLTQRVRGWREIEDEVADAWCGDWIAVIDPPAGRGVVRRRSEKALALLGFRSLRPTLAVRPNNRIGGLDGVRAHYFGLCEPAFDRASTAATPPARTPLFGRFEELDDLDVDRARELWDVAALEARYDRACERLAESGARIAALAPSEAMVETFLVGNRVLRSLLLDPMLPEPIVDRAARRALVDAMTHYDRLGRAQWSLFLAHFDAPHMKVATATAAPTLRIQP